MSLGVFFKPFSHLFSIKKPIIIRFVFWMPFSLILEPLNLENGALAYTKHSFSKTRLFRFRLVFRLILDWKMVPKSLQNASRNQSEKQTVFTSKKTPKMSPLRGSRGGPTNQLFAPKIPSGTPWAPQAAPERLRRVPWTIFD